MSPPFTAFRRRVTAKLKREKGVIETYEKHKTPARIEHGGPNRKAFRRLQRLVSDGPELKPRRHANAPRAQRLGSTRRGVVAHEPEEPPSHLPSRPPPPSLRLEDEGPALTVKLKRPKMREPNL